MQGEEENDSDYDDLKSEAPVLSVRDYLGNPQTLEFWKRYFTQSCLNVAVESFFEAI